MLRLTDAEIGSGADFAGVVTVVDDGEQTVHFESDSPLTALVFEAAGSTVVGVYTGGIAGTGAGADLAPGDSIDLDVVGGTAACDPALGYGLPAGSYQVRVPVVRYEYPDPGAGPDIHAIMSEPATLTVNG